MSGAVMAATTSVTEAGIMKKGVMAIMTVTSAPVEGRMNMAGDRMNITMVEVEAEALMKGAGAILRMRIMVMKEEVVHMARMARKRIGTITVDVATNMRRMKTTIFLMKGAARETRISDRKEMIRKEVEGMSSKEVGVVINAQAIETTGANCETLPVEKLVYEKTCSSDKGR
jgi:hypothetical protein